MGQDQKTYLVTGANRGLGLGITKELIAQGCRVLVTTRMMDGRSERGQTAAKNPQQVKVFTVDVSDQRSIETLAHDLKNETIDVLVNNAGIFLPDADERGQFKWDHIQQTFLINTLGPMRVTEALLPQLSRAARPLVITVSSLMGSIADNSSGGSYGYRISKAAVNMWSRSFAKDHKNITTVVIHPGWVQTDMGGRNAPLSIEESCKGMIQVMMSLDHSRSGEFLDYKGRPIPW